MNFKIKTIIREEIEKSEKEENAEEISLSDLPTDTDPESGVVAPSKKVISDICEKEKFCSEQGPITFGQLRSIVEEAQRKNLVFDIGEGFYKATLRLFPWFFPQIAIAGFIGSSVRAFNKIVRPGLEDTRGYKSWWGKTMMMVMDTFEGDIPRKDPISKIFFISDGLLHMMDKKFKLKFARYIAELAASKPDSEPVPEYFVENELRKWINQKFLLNPPLQPKTINESEDDFGWVRDIEVNTDLTPAQIKIRYDAFPLEVVGPNMPEFSDIYWEGGKLILYVNHWEDFAELFADNDSSQYGYINKWLAEKVLAEDDYWEPYSDVVYDWMDQVWDMVTDNEELLNYIKEYIKKNYVVPVGYSYNPNQLELFDKPSKKLDVFEIDDRILDTKFFNEIIQDNSYLGELIRDEDIFYDLKTELTWAYENAYNVAARDNIWKAAYGELQDIFGKGEWTSFQNGRGQTRHMLKFDVTDLVMDSVEKSIDDCIEGCKRYFDPERHYDEEEDESEAEAFEAFCQECHNFPFSEYGDFISFYRNHLYEWDELLNPRFDEYPDDKDIAQYFVEDVYGRI